MTSRPLAPGPLDVVLAYATADPRVLRKHAALASTAAGHDRRQQRFLDGLADRADIPREWGLRILDDRINAIGVALPGPFSARGRILPAPDGWRYEMGLRALVPARGPAGRRERADLDSVRGPTSADLLVPFGVPDRLPVEDGGCAQARIELARERGLLVQGWPAGVARGDIELADGFVRYGWRPVRAPRIAMA